MTLNLDGRHFRPVANSEGGRVTEDVLFIFTQKGQSFQADYSGDHVNLGHLIGTFTGPDVAELVYHSLAADGALQVGQATARFGQDEDAGLTINMEWRWLNGSMGSGRSTYREVPHD